MRKAYLDIETSYVGPYSDQRLFRDVRNHRITVIGIRIVDGDQDHLIQLVGEDATRENLMRALQDVGSIVTYNGRSIPDSVRGYVGFDFPVIAAQLGVVLDKEFKHIDLCPECWKAGLSGGQKAIEFTLGLKRKLPGKDGAWADKTWKEYEAGKDERRLSELLAYNKEDVLMLGAIEKALKSRKR